MVLFRIRDQILWIPVVPSLSVFALGAYGPVKMKTRSPANKDMSEETEPA